MATSNKKKRSESSTPPPSSPPVVIVRTGLSNCYNFLFPNEYSDQTFGLLAFLLRHAVGAINFSDLIDEAEQRSQRGQTVDFAKLLGEKRMSLPATEASIEKCLMLNRWISYIEQNSTEFIARMSNIRIEMKLKMTDSLTNQIINYPNDFRKREQDFNNRRNAQDVRRLFYLSHTEAKEPPSLIHLQNRTTEHLNYVIERMRCDSKFRETGVREVETILNNSFMIIIHPHYNGNPVTICNRTGPGKYTAKALVTIVSLLHDFMQQHPHLIELGSIEPSLMPSSNNYKLQSPELIAWKICELETSTDDRSIGMQYAELLKIDIEQADKRDTKVHFAQKVHSLRFKINFRINLPGYDNSKGNLLLETSSFAIGNNTCQIPRLLAQVMLRDVEKISKRQMPEITTITNYAVRYFIHRTGVMPNSFLTVYLEEELKKAENARMGFKTSEERFTDFLASFLHQVDFMARHPVLAMYYDDGQFLGICNSERVATILGGLSTMNNPAIAFRLMTIRIDYAAIGNKSIAGRIIEPNACAFRVDMYNRRTKKIENFTLDMPKLLNDLSSLISTSVSPDASRIRILSDFDWDTKRGKYQSFVESRKYHHVRLNEIRQSDETYKHLIDLIENVNNVNGQERCDRENNQNTNSNELHSADSRTTPAISLVTITVAQNLETNNSSVSGDNQVLVPNNVLPSNAELNRVIVDYVLSNPELLAEVINKYNMLQLAPPSQVSNQTLSSQSQVLYQHFQPQPQAPCHNPQSPVRYHNLYPRPLYDQSEQSLFQTQTSHQQQERSLMVNAHRPATVNRSQLCSANGVDNTSQQYSTGTSDVQIFDHLSNGAETTTDQMSIIIDNQCMPQNFHRPTTDS